jgi:hypothetical protein
VEDLIGEDGNSAVVPPSKTANRSSEITPSTIGLRRM